MTKQEDLLGHLLAPSRVQLALQQMGLTMLPKHLV